jgi:hypothetical protein
VQGQLLADARFSPECDAARDERHAEQREEQLRARNDVAIDQPEEGDGDVDVLRVLQGVAAPDAPGEDRLLERDPVALQCPVRDPVEDRVSPVERDDQAGRAQQERKPDQQEQERMGAEGCDDFKPVRCREGASVASQNVPANGV